ncbi:MAG: NADH-quinone oxidoreductase subunit N [Bacteroidota bacterium]
MNALYLICGLGFLSLLAEIANIKKGLTIAILIGIAAAGALMIMDWGTGLHYYNDMLVFDNFSVAYVTLILLIAIFWFWMSGDYFRKQSHQTDRSALVLFAITGAIIMVSFNNMAMLFLGIEILSISLYVLAGSNKESLLSNEASFKYFLMGSFATGFLLMGIALVYGATGSFHLTTIASFISANSSSLPGFFYAGVLLMLVGMAFKISAVPFHFWAPDVYEGSPVTITAFMSTIVKIAAIAAFYRVFSFCFSAVQSTWSIILQVITVLTLIVPNVTAVYQGSVKRMLAYSSVGHIGYILLAFIANSASSAGTIFYYLASYAITSIAAFSVLHEVENSKPASGFDGLYKRSPVLAVVMTVALLSLAGIPPLAGFFGKYMVFTQALNNGYSGVVIIAVVTSLIGVFYYFRVIISMFTKTGEESPILLSASSKLLMVILLVLILLMGVFPDRLISIL